MDKNQTNIRASILDRLIDNEPGFSREPVQYRATNFRNIEAAVGRDLENLLNTRNFFSTHAADYKELGSSVLVYGLPDFTSANPKSLSVRNRLRQELEKKIMQFEPRLHNVMVRIEESEINERNVRFKINAILLVDTIAEPVTFDTVLDVNRCEYSVRR